jgi:mannose-1-phosphate guanylyltransferase/mannose-6-phosphate isomerase
MCGGAGTRLWPVSRESMPKQFVSLVGPGSTSLRAKPRILARIVEAHEPMRVQTFRSEFAIVTIR